MKQIILDRIPFQPDRNQLIKRLHVDINSEDGARLMSMIEQAEGIGRPKAIYTLASIDSKDEDGVIVDGIRLSSYVMRVNFADINLFPMLLPAAGFEWAACLDDMRNINDIIMEQHCAN